MPKAFPPPMREKFAKQLKQLRRAQFPHARLFAKMLGIDENRYTRYERAEAEPDLTLISKILKTLRATPNELFNVLLEPDVQPKYTDRQASAPGDSPDRAGEKALRAWELAAAVVAVQQKSENQKSNVMLANMTRILELSNSLRTDPVGTVATIVDDPAVKSAAKSQKEDIGSLIGSFMKSNIESLHR